MNDQERAEQRAAILALPERELTFKLNRIIEVIRAAAIKGGFGDKIMFNKSCVPTQSPERACFSVPISKLRKTPQDAAFVIGHINGTYPSDFN